MTRFVEKIIVYYDYRSSSRIVVRVKRDYEEKRVIILESRIENVETDELGEILSWHTEYSHYCSFSSWQQFLNRRYDSAHYIKDKEIYIY